MYYTGSNFFQSTGTPTMNAVTSSGRGDPVRESVVVIVFGRGSSMKPRESKCKLDAIMDERCTTVELVASKVQRSIL